MANRQTSMNMTKKVTEWTIQTQQQIKTQNRWNTFHYYFIGSTHALHLSSCSSSFAWLDHHQHHLYQFLQPNININHQHPSQKTKYSMLNEVNYVSLHFTRISPKFSLAIIISGCPVFTPPFSFHPPPLRPSSLEAVTVCVDKSHKDCKVPEISPPWPDPDTFPLSHSGCFIKGILKFHGLLCFLI